MTTKIKSSNLSTPIDIVGDLNISDKIVHRGDTNTAIRFPAVDTVTVETAGAERLRIDASGNIGIGTSNPTAKLHILGDLKSGNFYGSDGAYIDKRVEDVSSANGLTVYTDNYRNSNVAISGTLSSGIDVTAYLGTDSSLTKTAQGGSVVGASSYALLSPSNGTTTSLITGVYGNASRLGSGTGVLTTGVGVQGDTSGPMLNSVSFRAFGSTNGSPVTNQYGFYSDINTAQATNSWSVYANGAASSYFGGNVGIGTTSPTNTLTVDGTIGGSIVATQAEAEAGADNTKLMTPLRTSAAIIAQGTPAGTVSMFAGASPPSGWLVANGAVVSRTTYAALFAAIGTTWGAGNGSTTFSLPDGRNRYGRGSGTTGVGGYLGQSTQQHGHRTSMGFDGGAFFGWRDAGGLPIFGQELFSALRVVTSGSSATTGLRIAYTEASMINVTGETRPESITYLPIIKF